MPIEALPLSTAKRIYSAQVILDPYSVVKELLDNSLDARATSVSIEISSNTLDAIRVRDNGHGIPHGDRTLVCVRHCTSKLRNITELRAIAGTWLGFRGQALNSLATISGGLNITTRTEGEIAAEKLEIGKSGEITRREIVPHPMGTTVCTTDLFHDLPVRKQTSLKFAAGCLARIKKLLQAYSLAKPNVRLSLKILKTKTEEGTFTYAPKSNGGGTVEDAAFKVIGRACTSQCVWTTFNTNGLELQAFIPRTDADPLKITGHGSFISVDSRPVSANRGTLKQIVSKFRDAIRKSHPNLEGVKAPFLFLNIVCPPGSYDPNVEPAKDDVLFENSGMVINAVEKLLTTFYSVTERPNELLFDANDQHNRADKEVVSLSHPSTMEVSPMSQNFERITRVGDTQAVQNGGLAFPKQRLATHGWRTNMYECDDEDFEIIANEHTDPSCEEQQRAEEILKNVNLLNPWTIARMVARRNANTGTTGKMSEKHHREKTQTNGLTYGSIRSTHRRGELASPTLPQDETMKRYLPNIGSTKKSNPIEPAESMPLRSYPCQLPSPASSSSPVYGVPLDTIAEASIKMQQRQRPQGNTKIPYLSRVQPNRERNRFQFAPSHYSEGDQVAKEGRSRDVRDLTAANSKAGNVQLVVHDKIDDRNNVYREISTPFRALKSRPEDHRILRASNVTLCTQVVPGNIHNAVPQENENMACQRSQTNCFHRTEISMLPLEHISENDRIQHILITLQLNLANIASHISILSKDTNHPEWLTLPDSSSSGFLPFPNEKELDRWCNRLRMYLHPVLNDENDFNGFHDQIDEAFTKAGLKCLSSNR